MTSRAIAGLSCALPGLGLSLILAVSDGSRPTRSVKRPDRTMLPTIPHSNLPAQFFTPDRWGEIAQGRWNHSDHIVLGEGRAVIKLLNIVLQDPQQHGTYIINLEDNAAISGSFMKGRSAIWALNFLCRKKAALCLSSGSLLMLPWVETSLQPADCLSRILERSWDSRDS